MYTILLYLFLILYYYLSPTLLIVLNIIYQLKNSILKHIIRISSCLVLFMVWIKALHDVRVFTSLFACGPYCYPIGWSDMERFYDMVSTGKIMIPEIPIWIFEFILILLLLCLKKRKNSEVIS